MRDTMSSTRAHWPWPTWEGPLQAAPMQKRVLPLSFARSAACPARHTTNHGCTAHRQFVGPSQLSGHTKKHAHGNHCPCGLRSASMSIAGL